MTMYIQEKQNCLESLEKLQAQFLLDRRARFARYLRCACVIFVGILVVPTFFTENENFSQFVVFVALSSAFLDKIVFKSWESTLRKEAATIREEFDCFVLSLPWPDHKGIKHPPPDRIHQLATRGRHALNDRATLKDWYTPTAIPDDPGGARVYCQQMNCSCDVQLRRNWITFLTVVFWCFLTVTVLVASITGLTVAKLIAIVGSDLKVLGWGVSELREQAGAIERIDGIHHYLSSFAGGISISSAQSRCIQDEIFEQRCSNPPVPNWFYRWKRGGQEMEAAKPCQCKCSRLR